MDDLWRDILEKNKLRIGLDVDDMIEAFGTKRSGTMLPGTGGSALAVDRNIRGILGMGRDGIEKAIRDLAKRVYRVENEVSDIGDGLHGILQGLDEPATARRDGSSPPTPGRGRRRCIQGGAEGQQILRNLAGAGVTRVDFNPLPSGRTRVTIDGDAGIELPPVLVNLLRVLCADCGDSNDGLVGFKTPSEVARLLGKKADKEVKRQAVREAVRRLRRALIASGYNPYLLQSDRRWGYRFALRRSDDDVSVTDGV